jgi:uncharacterized protein (TIGR03437 family)
MTRRNKFIAGVVVAVSSAALIFGYATGPDPRYTGAPGDDPKACTSSGCHSDHALNSGGGNVVVTFPDGLTYTPGVQQKLTIVITDSVAKVYGFQMTARLDSNLAKAQAGDFTAGADQVVLCENSSFKGSKGCPANFPVQFIEHTKPFVTNSMTVIWTPPATDVGGVHIYVAANAANGDGNNTGDHIYTANYALTPKAAGPPKPAITDISPSSVPKGSPDLTLTVNGSGFVSGSVVNFNTTKLTTVFGSGTSLTATIPANLLTTVGAATITVTNLDASVSGGVTFTIASDLAITSVSPTSVQAGSPGVQLTITGKGFVSGSKVNFGGTAVPTTFGSATSLTANVAANLIATGGTALITVSNPDGSVANGPNFVITSQPFITAVVNGASFQPGIESGSWSTIFGTNLSTTTRIWNTDTEIINGKLPLSLDGVSVMVNNKAAAIYFISPGQINFQAPDDTVTGAVTVTVTNSGGTSPAMPTQLQRDAPGFFMFDPQARKYVAALVANADGTATFLGPPNLFGSGGAVTRPAKPGEILELYGTGFGPTNPAVTSGLVVTKAAQTIDKVSITIGGMDAEVQFAGITGAGLYQINAKVPANLTTGDQKIVATVNGLQTPDGAFVTISTK